jgi:hypothetical protein
MMKKNNGRKPVGNSGLYGRVTRKQMGGSAKPIGMSGPSRGIVAGDRTPYDKYMPKITDFGPSEEDLKRIRAKENYYKDRARNEGPIMRTNDFQDEDMNGVDDRDEKKGTGRQPAPRTEKDPRTRNRGSMPSREELQRIADAFSGKARTGGPRRRGRGNIFDRLKDQARRRTESPYEPKMPGGGRLRPPVMGPDPDIGRMMPRRFEGLGATLVDALGIKSKGMGDKSRREPPRPRTTGGRRGRGRRK